MNKDKRNNIQLLGTLNNADESGIIANANQVYDANEDKSTQDVSKEHKERIETLETKESSMQTTLENITKTGEASAASNVAYNHNDSQLDATNVQQAVDEVSSIGHFAKRGGIVNISTNYNSINTAEILTLEQAIAKVPSKDRVLGFQGKFLTKDGWESYIFIGTSIAEWDNKSKWDKYYTREEIDPKFSKLESKQPYPQMIFGYWVATPNITFLDNVLSCDNFGCVICTNGRVFYETLPAMNLQIDIKNLGDTCIICYNADTQSYLQLKYSGDINSIDKSYYIVGFISNDRNFHANGLYKLNGIERQYSGLSDKGNLNQYSYKNGIIGEDISITEITTSKNGDKFSFTMNIPRYIYVDNKCINVGRSYSKNIALNKTGLYRIYLKSDLTDILLSAYNEENTTNGCIFLGTFTLNADGSISKPYFYGDVTINGVDYTGFEESNLTILNKKYDVGFVGLHTQPATLSAYTTDDGTKKVSIRIPDYIITNRDIFNINSTLTADVKEIGIQRLYIKRSDKTLHCLSHNNLLTYNEDNIDYIYIGSVNLFDSNPLSVNIFGKCYYNNNLYVNGNPISNTTGNDSISAISQKCVTDLFAATGNTISDNKAYLDRTLGFVGLHKGVATIDCVKEDEKYYVILNIPNYIYTIRNNINVNNTFKCELKSDGLYSLLLKNDGSSMVALPYYEDASSYFSKGYNIFLGVFKVDNRTILLLTDIQLFGRWKYNDKTYSTIFPEEISTRLSDVETKLNSISTGGNTISETDMCMYAYNKMYLIKDEEYEIFKDSFYYDNKNGFRDKDSNIVVTTDTDVFIGNNLSVRFNTRGVTSYSTDNAEENKLSIYIDNGLSKSTNGYGIRCDLTTTNNISGKSIKHTAIGDSQTDNGLIRALGEYLRSKNFTYNGVGITSDGGYANEGRSGWRYENIIGRSNAQGWGAIEVIYPEGDVKSTDKLHKNPFIRLATDDDKKLYPTKCYTFTAESQTTAHYLEKSYQDIVNEGGDTTQNFYIFDIANYYKVQHDWDGNGNPVDAITFAFSTNEFIIEGYTDDTINRLIENVKWVLQRCREQLPNVKIGFIACPAWSYSYSDDKYKVVLKWFKRLTELVDNVNTYIIQPHLFMSRAIYSYNRGISSNNINESMIQRYTSGDGTHYDSIGNYQYAKCLAGWIVSLVE